MTQRLAQLVLAIFASVAFFGCETTCEYPDLQTFRLRLLNAMPDQPKITVFIDGKLFKRDFAYNPPEDFGYTDTYEDGTPLPLGDSLEVVVTSDAAGIMELHRGFIKPSLHQQTLIIAGRGMKLVATDVSNTRTIFLDDEDATPQDTAVMIRIVHAIPDLVAIDVYFRGIPTDGSPLGPPNLTLSYGEVSPRMVISSLPGLTVTEKNNPANVIFSASTPFDARGFFITAVLRGFAKPCASEPVPAPLLLSDVKGGKVVFDFSVFGVRFVNATTQTTLSLMAANPKPQDQEPRTNIPGQGKVLNVAPSVATEYFGVGVAALGNTRWFFGRTSNKDTVFGTQLTSKVNERWTFVAYQNPDESFNGLKLKDTMVCTPESHGKIRFVNLSPQPGGPVTVTITGETPITLAQGDIGFSTVTAGSKEITISIGGTTQSHWIVVPAARPISLYILPPKSGSPFPVITSPD